MKRETLMGADEANSMLQGEAKTQATRGFVREMAALISTNACDHPHSKLE